jgi:hypothetical protein
LNKSDFIITGALAGLAIALVTTPMLLQFSYALILVDSSGVREAPIAISGDNTYIACWTNKTGNDEVMFRASDDGGATFADKINLSSSTNADSVNTEIAADFNNVVISWWEQCYK